MMLMILATIGCLTAVMSIVIWQKHKLDLRLERPVLEGIPLPAVDDPRWEKNDWVSDCYTLGSKATSGVKFLACIVVDASNDGFGAIKLQVGTQNHLIGFWKAYAKQVAAHIHAKTMQEVCDKTLDLIENAK